MAIDKKKADRMILRHSFIIASLYLTTILIWLLLTVKILGISIAFLFSLLVIAFGLKNFSNSKEVMEKNINFSKNKTEMQDSFPSLWEKFKSLCQEKNLNGCMLSMLNDFIPAYVVKFGLKPNNVIFCFSRFNFLHLVTEKEFEAIFRHEASHAKHNLIFIAENIILKFFDIASCLIKLCLLLMLLTFFTNQNTVFLDLYETTSLFLVISVILFLVSRSVCRQWEYICDINSAKEMNTAEYFISALRKTNIINRSKNISAPEKGGFFYFLDSHPSIKKRIKVLQSLEK